MYTFYIVNGKTYKKKNAIKNIKDKYQNKN